MPRIRLRWCSPRNLFVLLSLVSIGLFFLPAGWLPPFLNPAALLAPAGGAISRVVRWDFPSDSPAHLEPASQAAPGLELQELRHRVASQAARIEALERENLALSHFHNESISGGRLVSARVIGGDALPWRQGLWVASGLSFSIGSGVVSHCFVDRGSESDVERGMSVLAGEALVGFVDRVSHGTATIRLLGDVDSRMPVRMARIDGDDVRILDRRFWLTGSLEGRLFVRDVNHEYLETGEIALGDIVLTVENDTRLPIPVNIGSIRSSRVQRDNRLLYDLEVEPSIAPQNLNRVYIVDTNAT